MFTSFASLRLESKQLDTSLLRTSLFAPLGKVACPPRQNADVSREFELATKAMHAALAFAITAGIALITAEVIGLLSVKKIIPKVILPVHFEQ